MTAFSEIINEHKSFSGQILKLAKSDLIRTYRGAALGWAWAIVKPMITLFVFWFAFTVGLRSGKPIAGHPYFLWLVAGFLPWFYMSDMITQGSACIRNYKHLVTKMKFPISVIPTYFSISHLYVHFALLGISILLYACFGFFPDVYYIQLIFYMFLMFIMSISWNLFTGLMSALSKDFQNLIRSLSQAIFWMSGVIYDVNRIDNGAVRLLLKFNPVTVITNGYRYSFVYKQWFWEDPIELACFVTTFVVFTVLALWAFKKVRKDIPDVL